MTKKHFIALADRIRRLTPADISPRAMDELCYWMREANPRFDERRWRDYVLGECGPNGGKVKR